MDEYHKDSDQVVGKVLEAYQTALDEINASMNKIFNTYAKNGSLSNEEALRRLTNLEAKETLASLEKIVSEVSDDNLRRELLSRINAPAYRARLTRLEALKEQLNAEVVKIADVQVRTMDKGLYNTAETAFYKTMFDMQRSTGFGFSFSAIPNKRIEDILKNNWSGKHYSKRVWENTQAMSSELEHVLTKGMMNGAGVRKMAKEMSERMNVGMSAATRLIRTETTYVANASELQAYKEAGVEKLQYLATLDTKTSDICRRHDGEVITVDKAEPGRNIPPLHANCRSTTLEIFEDDNLAELKKAAIDPVTGKRILIPANMNYNDWHNKYVKGEK